MKLKEWSLNWNVLSSILLIELPKTEVVFPLRLEVFDAAGQLIYEKELSHLPYSLKSAELSFGNFTYHLLQGQVLIATGQLSVP